ncbi:MAG: tripartite tricarboxylate transporter substrate binding protein, partial [Comamonadaceae bacterium]
LAGEYFKQVAKLDMLHVPFKGATQALPVLVQGDVDLFFDMVATGMPQANAGKVKVLGITSKSRMNILPDVPTIAEQGYPGFEMTAWFSFVAPKGTPEPVLEKLRSALAVALKDDKVRASMGTMGIEPRQGTAQELISQIRSEQPVIEQLVQRANVQVQ